MTLKMTLNDDTNVNLFCVFQIKKFEKLESDEERIKAGKEIYDQFIMKELLSQSHVSIAHLLMIIYLL